ncbi:MAG: hypothetical protein ACTSQY_09005 [Candidatus Odinarchaeia archaeon]
MPIVTKEIRCSNCGAPLNPGEHDVIVTCNYCGSTQMIDVGKPFILSHSLLPIKYLDNIEDVIKSWMRKGFLKPKDLAKKAKITSKELEYLPFWIISVKTHTEYEGIFERITPAKIKKDSFKREYNWRILGRRGTSFPIKEFDIPIEKRIPFEFSKLPRNVEILNSEIDEEEAKTLTKQQIEELQRYLILKDVDRIIDFKIDFDFDEVIYLHAPIWFIKYKYKNKNFEMIIDANEGTVIKGEFPFAE